MVVNIGVSVGIFLIKGFILLLVSYGGLSLIVMVVVVLLLFRIDFELCVVGV